MGAAVSVVALSDAPVGSLIWQRPPNAPVLTIVCRATFVLAPGEATLAAEQEPIAAAERPYPDGSSRGVYAPCDLVPMKPAADVVLVGQAFAPGQKPVRSLVARLVVGDVDKRVEVFCDRHFDPQGALREGPPFATLPLVYERAAGGPDTPNPIGVRSDARDAYGRLALPNLQPAGLEIATPTDAIAHVGFGPIASAWPSRRALLGAAAAAQVPGEWQGPHLPADMDPSFFHAAPRDQRLSSLREDERIGLENLHPTHAELSTRLPGMRPHAFVEGRAGPQPLAMRADTLWIETTRGIAVMTWRGQLRLDGPSPAVRVLVAVAPSGRALSREDLERMDRARTPQHASGKAPKAFVETKLGASRPLPASVMPFAPTPAQPAAPLPTPKGAEALPFHAAGTPAPAPLAAPPKVERAKAAFVLTLPLPPAVVPAPARPPGPVEIAWGRGDPPTIAPVPRAPIAVEGTLPPVQPAAVAPSIAAARTPLELIWLDPEGLPPLRRDPRFSRVLAALDERPLDPDLDDPDAAVDVADVDERRDAFEVLARGAATDEAGVIAALAEAVSDDGRLVQPIVLVAGELLLAFDELSLLEATLSATAPSAGADPETKALLDTAKDLMGAPGQPPAAAVSGGLAARIRDTFEKRGLVAAGVVDAQVGRALVQGRHYQRRSLLGSRLVRASLQTGDGAAIPAYLGHEAAAQLPAAERLRVRALAMVHPTLDHQETHPAALRVVALAVVGTPPLGR